MIPLMVILLLLWSVVHSYETKDSHLLRLSVVMTVIIVAIMVATYVIYVHL